MTLLDIKKKYGHMLKFSEYARFNYGPINEDVLQFLVSEIERLRNNKQLDEEEDEEVRKFLEHRHSDSSQRNSN